MTGSTHRKTCRLRRQQPAKTRAQAVRSGRPDSLLSAPLRGLAAVAFSNVWIIVRDFFQCLNTSSNAVSLRSLISTPAVFQVPFSPGSVNSTRQKPSLQTRPPKPPGNSPRVCAYGANVAAICLFGGKTCPTLFSIVAPDTARAGASWPSLGSLRSAVRLRRVHSARIRHATARTPCHAGCFALRSRMRLRSLCAPEARNVVGASGRKVLFV